MAIKPSRFIGDWRIIEMETWDRDFTDMEVPAYIKFEKNGAGAFQFGLVKGYIDHRATERDGKPAVEFSWEGFDEMDPVTGRGWAALNDDGGLEGNIFIHMGEESGFTAIRQQEKRRRKSS